MRHTMTPVFGELLDVGLDIGPGPGLPSSVREILKAFKPTAVSLKTQLESLGCQAWFDAEGSSFAEVKGYKTHKNAARLDCIRLIVVVTGRWTRSGVWFEQLHLSCRD